MDCHILYRIGPETFKYHYTYTKRHLKCTYFVFSHLNQDALHPDLPKMAKNLGKGRNTGYWRTVRYRQEMRKKPENTAAEGAATYSFAYIDSVCCLSMAYAENNEQAYCA
jgi:hypothetical protein